MRDELHLSYGHVAWLILAGLVILGILAQAGASAW